MEKKAIRIKTIFMGTSDFAADILEALIAEKYNLVSVFTQPGKKSGREQKPTPSAVRVVAEKNKLTVFEPEKLDEKTVEEIKKQMPDLIIVAAYGKIIPKSILEIPGFGIINVHPSLLPKFRGPSPIQNTLLSGEKETGTTIMLMDEGIDSGDILSQEKVAVDEKDLYEDLSKKLTALSWKLLLETLPDWIERKIKPQPQESGKATYCQLIERSDGKIIWDNEAREIFNCYRAFHRWPGIFCYLENDNGIKRLKLNSIDFQDNNPDSQEKKRLGEVFRIADKIAVQTGKGLIFLKEVQLEGKKNISIEEFINGYPDFIGSLLK